MIETIDKIYSKKDGKFEIRYHYGYKDDGTSNYKSVYSNSETEVINNYHKTIDEIISKNDLLMYDKTYVGYDIYLWLNNSKIKNKKSTYSNYHYTIKSRIILKFANVKKKAISLELINKFTTELLIEGLVEKTVKDILIILQQILKYGNINIKIPMPKVPKMKFKSLEKMNQQSLKKNY